MKQLTSSIFGGVLVGGVCGFFWSATLTQPEPIREVQEINLVEVEYDCHERAFQLVEYCLEQRPRLLEGCIEDGTSMMEHCHEFHEDPEPEEPEEPSLVDLGVAPDPEDDASF